MTYCSQILGTGSAFPKRAMHNSEFEKFLETSDEWIRTRTGIKTRHIADPALGESTLSLAEQASKKALEMAGVKASDVDLIMIGTVTPNNIMPTTANQLQANLGAKGAASFDLQAACSGFLYGLSIADSFIKTGKAKTALVIGAETLSTLLNWKDRSTCILFGDGAGAMVLGRGQSGGVLGTKIFSDGTYGNLLCIPHGYSKVPPDSPNYSHQMHKIHMQGREVFKLAVKNMVHTSQELLKECGLETKDVDFFLFHQANLRIIDVCARLLHVDKEKTWINLDRYGNTSAATLPVCFDEAWRAGKIKSGDKILMTTFGGGLTWGSALVQL